jgi:Rad3-related DNA helicase
MTGKEWYFAETYRSINQAIGRVVRSVNDYGAIYLIDERFEKTDIKDQISEWVRNKL